MPVTDTALRRLHEILLQVADIRGQIERGPKQIKAAQSQLQVARDALAQCKEAIKQADGGRSQAIATART